jgi:hypothetical protein
MPTRWNTLIALGDADRHRESASSRIVPSPMRGAGAWESSSGPSLGNAPSATITAKRSNTEVGALELAGLTGLGGPGLTGQDGDHLAAVTHRDGPHPG